ncbi:CHAT domain-containing protein [Tenacibaculum aiptasiae]|uniref:CHAT domain-containing protein n=1 Tax=Tenacibaculum aiptasiae TaxID=426481 RepID=UPI00232CD7B5|nr:CHAT domain-containing tetratricopeptide repeat protein [Tenacibaculum aiptasiae]
MGQIDKTKNYSEKEVDSILSRNFNKANYAELAHDFSFYFYRKKKNYRLAIKYGKIEIETIEKQPIVNDSVYANALYNLGNFFKRVKEHDTAISYYIKAIRTKDFPLKKAQAYCELGKYYRIKGELYKSFDYYEKGLPLIKKYSTAKSFMSHCINFSLTCHELNTKKSNTRGLFYLKKVDSLQQSNPKLNIPAYFYPLHINLGNLYSTKKTYNYKKAKYHYKKNLKRAFKENNSIVISFSYLNLGDLYLKKGNDSSIVFLEKSIIYDTQKSAITSDANRNIANYYVKKQQLSIALTYFDQSLNVSFSTDNSDDMFLLSKEKLLNTLEKRNTMKALKGKISILFSLYSSTSDVSYLKEAIKLIDFSDKFVQTIIEYSTENDTRFLWRQEVSEIYALGAHVSYLLNNPAFMFNYIEKNKAFLLTLDVYDNIQDYKLPKKVITKELAYKKQILKLENNPTLTDKKKLRDSLFNLKEQYAIFNDSLKQIYPQHYENKKEIIPISLNEVKQLLKEDDIIISYTLTNDIYNQNETSNLLGVLISKNKTLSFTTKNSSDINHVIYEYKKLISKPLQSKKELESFKQVSFKLYNLLFPTKEIRNLIQHKNLIIIPDARFENIPFESLNTQKNKLKYLVENTNVSYAYSYSFMNYNSQFKRDTEVDLVSFAPVNFHNPKLTSLNNTIQETNNINHLFDEVKFQYDEASKSNFFKNSSNSKIIHLATHANYTHTPTIYFSKDSLKLHELYTFKNNADLVVLSACETNLGEVKKGEGTLSLSRGFFHSGTNAVLSSLWSVNDKATSFIMSKFYKNIKENQSKSEALNNAKRQYLQNHSLGEKSPYYWASFVLIGDTEPVFYTNIWIYIITGFIATSFLIFFFKKRKLNLKG